MKIKYIENWYENFILPLLEDCPDSQIYYSERIPAMLGCSLKDTVLLEVVNPNYDKGEGEDFVDDEGWDFKAFFPEGFEIKNHMINNSHETKDMAIGEVGTLFVNGIMFYYEMNASPIMIFTNKNNF